MNKINKKILLFFLFSFAIYCALIIGEAWDESSHLTQGKITLEYLFSLGNINKDLPYRENYSSLYWSLQYLLTIIFPSQYQIEISHLVNLIFGLGTIIGAGKIGKEIFNNKVGKLIFLILFFYPVFFGHMAINSKDLIIAFSHIWITYLVLRYLKKQNIKVKANNYVIYIALLAALAMGIQIIFLGSLIPIFLFILIDIFFFKKFINNYFSNKKFLFDLVKCFIIFYFILILFWIDTHPNIFILPFNIIMESLTSNNWTGWPFNLINGNYYMSNEIPKSYLLINLFYKSPEYILISYFLFLILIIKSRKFFKKKFKFFNYKISLIFFILIFPNLILFVIPYPVYDGMRLFLWILPYICIIPALTIYYLTENIKFVASKLSLLFLSIFIVYFLFHFFSITPYQYTYLNLLNGRIENRYKKFENDYWASSIKELIKNSNFDKNKIITFGDCGISSGIAENYLKKKGYTKIVLVPPEKANYIIMTNRVVLDSNKNSELKLINCLDNYSGEDLFKVERNGFLLSVIRKRP